MSRPGLAEPWLRLLAEPDDLADEAGFAAWFARIAARLLCGSRLVAGGTAHRFTEVEAYYHGRGHLDLFAHRDPVQKGTGVWYFHRTAGVLRGGSFKGVDLAFGGPEAFAGMLVRGLAVEPAGKLVDGPSLCVDHLIGCTGAGSVSALDRAVAGKPAWDAENPLRLQWLPEEESRELLRTARVGLSLKRLKKADEPTRFLLRPYRFLTEPRRISKGKLHMALALLMAGEGLESIREKTGCTRAALVRYAACHAEGAKEEGFDAYFGIALGPRELARLHGLWQAKHGP